MTNIAVFASGSGTNAENIIRYFSNNTSIKPALVISNKKDAYVLQRAEKLNVPAQYIPTSQFKNNPQHALQILKKYKIDFIVLAGFMILVPVDILKEYENRILNIHPALLPDYGGKGMYGQNVHKAVIAAGEKQSGISIHFVNEKYDKGKIIFQATCPVSENDDPESLAEKIHELEYEHYPPIIESVITQE